MLVPLVFANLVLEVESKEILELLAEILLSIVSKSTACVTVTKSVFASILVISQALVQIPDISWSPVLVPLKFPKLVTSQAVTYLLVPSNKSSVSKTTTPVLVFTLATAQPQPLSSTYFLVAGS